VLASSLTDQQHQGLSPWNRPLWFAMPSRRPRCSL